MHAKSPLNPSTSSPFQLPLLLYTAVLIAVCALCDDILTDKSSKTDVERWMLISSGLFGQAAEKIPCIRPGELFRPVPTERLFQCFPTKMFKEKKTNKTICDGRPFI